MSDSLVPSVGELSLRIKSDKNDPLLINLDGTAKLTPDWYAYGHLWTRPLDGRFGGEAGLKYRDSIDIFVSGEGSVSRDGFGREYSVVGGVKWRF